MCKCIFLLRFFVAPVSLFPAIYDALVPRQQNVQQSVSHYVVQHMQAILNPRIVYFRGKRRKEKKALRRRPAKKPDSPNRSSVAPFPSPPPPPIPQLPITERKKTNFQRRYLSQSSHPAARRKATEPTFLRSLRRFGRKNWWWKEGGSGFSFSPLFARRLYLHIG